ncbi:MAG TPA: HEAT repeat domain-containing protein [Polyangiaceae bacterium]|nr:HEAT repeat domain-containing protein [Polyangiaceae bacterium]
MLEPNLPNLPPPSASRPPPSQVYLAKWPPDDDGPAVPPAPGGGFPGSFDMGDGNFKKGRFNPVVILIGVLAVAGLAAFLLIGFKQDAEKLTVEQAEDRKKAIFVLPKNEQIPQWRQWAGSEASDELRSEALKQLAWAKDPEGVALAVKALSYPSEGVQSMAATSLAEYGRPLGEPARDALLAALKTAGKGAKPQIAWALVVLGDTRAFDEIMQLYRLGHLSTVQRLGGGVAFDAAKIVDLVSLDKLASMANDESPSVRQLVATVLSDKAEPKWTDVLIKLVQDKDPDVARQAAPGLGRIAESRAREPLIDAMKTADKDSRKKFLEALRDGIGTEGLVLGLRSVSDDEKLAWYQTKQVFDMIHDTKNGGQGLNDPRGGNALYSYIESKPHTHYQWRAAVALAAIGDVRAVPTLAKRLRMDPLKIYSDQRDWEMELKRDDNERVIASRMIADLAMLHPEKRQQIAEQAEDAVIFWIHELPSPHANGLRALAAMESTKDMDALRKWANPNVPLPKEGQQPPMPEEFVVAQSALRYVGWMKDQRSWGVLEKSLNRRKNERDEYDVTMEGLMQGGVAILGMSLRALGVGAAQGFSEWRDHRAFKWLLDYVADVKNNEQSRSEACAALAWVAEKDDFLEVAKRIQEYGGSEKSDQFRRACLLETLIQRPVPGTAPALMSLMTPESSLSTRHQVARAIAKGGFDQSVEAKLFEMMNSDVLVNDAALALILGGTPETAARAVALYANKPKATLDELGELWYQSFGYWSTEDLESGLLFKYVDNAEAITRLSIRMTPQEWARVMLIRQLDNLVFDNGPHSFTRVVLRHRLWQMAKGNDEAKRQGAIRTLKFMKEQGPLLALRDEQGQTGQLARAAYFELMNPKLVSGVAMPDDEKK